MGHSIMFSIVLEGYKAFQESVKLNLLIHLSIKKPYDHPGYYLKWEPLLNINKPYLFVSQQIEQRLYQ